MMKRWISFLLCGLFLCACAPVRSEAPGDEMRLFAINVGKADCLLLGYQDCVYMVDTGTAESWGAVSAALSMLGITELTGVIVTHTDNDHAGGCMTLAASPVKIGAWYASAYYAGVKEGKHKAENAASLRGQQVIWLRAGDELPFGTGCLRVLGPMRYFDKENCNSVVLLAEGGGGRMLLAGDMEFPEEEELLQANAVPRCDVLKVGNHGESDATSDALVQAVRPRVAVISTNTNEEPDTPANRVLKALKRVSAQIVVTQSSQAGVLVTIKNGDVRASLASYTDMPAKQTGVKLTAKDKGQFTATVTNTTDQAVDVSGWFLRSERGGETFIFPANSRIGAGQSVTITSLSTNWQGDYVWQAEKVWHKSKDDAGELYDQYGRLIDRLE